MKTVSLILVLGLIPAPGQQPSPPADLPNISVEVEVVNLFFTVRNKQGGYASNLDKSDFTVEEDGRPQTIRYFSRQSDLPLTLGLLVDTSVSQGNLIEQERDASSRFFTQVLRVRKDQAFLISFDIHVDLLQDFTDSSRLLRAALDKLRVNGGAGSGGGPVPTSGKPKGTLLYDAVLLASQDMMKNQVGRKALVLITDGNDYGSQTSLKEAVAAAHRADDIIYSVLYLDPWFYRRMSGPGVIMGVPDGSSTLRKMSEETGGRLFEVGRKNNLTTIYDEIQQELRNQYSIGYTPSDTGRSGEFHRVKIIPRNRDLKVQARQGYYRKTDKP